MSGSGNNGREDNGEVDIEVEGVSLFTASGQAVTDKE